MQNTSETKTYKDHLEEARANSKNIKTFLELNFVELEIQIIQ